MCSAPWSSTSTSPSPGPGPTSGPRATGSSGSATGSTSTRTATRQARAAAVGELKRHPELDHDEEIWILFTERIIVGMGGRGDTRSAATEMERRWVQSEHFELYDDALPVLDFLRERQILIGLLSNSARNLDEFVVHHGLLADAVLTSHVHGKTKPHDSIFRALLAQLDVAPEEAVMVGDTVEDDVEGALAVGMRAVLLDREGRYPDVEGRLDDLRELPAAARAARA